MYKQQTHKKIGVILLKTIVVSQLKGGSAKTATVTNLGVALARQFPVEYHDETLKDLRIRSRVLFVDCDGQMNMSSDFGFSHKDCLSENGKGIKDILLDCVPASEVVEQVYPKIMRGDKHKFNYGVITGYKDISALLESVPDEQKDGNFVYRLADSLESVKNDYDYCIIDSPVALKCDLIYNAFIAADYVIIPVFPDKHSIDGLDELYERINYVKKLKNDNNSDLKILGILICDVETRPNIDKKKSNDIITKAAELGIRVFETTISHCSAMRAARDNMISLVEYDRNAQASKDYLDVAFKEVRKVIYDDIHYNNK